MPTSGPQLQILKEDLIDDPSQLNDDQMAHDAAMVAESFLPKPAGSQKLTESQKALIDEVLSRSSDDQPLQPSAPSQTDPFMEELLEDYPGLTREKAEEMIEAFGY